MLASVLLRGYLTGIDLLRGAEWRAVTLLDWRVLSLLAGSILVLTLLVSLTPILSVRRLGIGYASRHVTARASLAQRLAGTAQTAVAAAFAGAAIAFGWYLGSLTLGYPGYEITDRYAVTFNPFITNRSGQSGVSFDPTPGRPC
jgi:hypothetical protein